MDELSASVRLTPTEERIYDIVRRAGQDGVDLAEFMGSERSRDCIKAHVWNLNRKLAAQNQRVVGARGGSRGAGWLHNCGAWRGRDFTHDYAYRLVKLPRRT